MKIPAAFARNMRELYGRRGQAWLESLPGFLADFEKRWSFTLQPPFPNLSYNFAAPGTRADGTAVVLKIGVVNPELLAEIEALRLFAGRGLVRLLEADPDQGAFLLERINPGRPLIELEDDEAATAVAADVMARFWRPAPAGHPFPTVAGWAGGMTRLRAKFNGSTGPFPQKLVEMAESLFAWLIPSQAAPVLLHGDLHHWNILSAEGGSWLAIDPKGLLGEPAYEVGAWLRNPFDRLAAWPDLNRIQARRVDQFTNRLGFERERIIGWGIAQAVLSAWWSYEDHGRVEQGVLTCAEALACLQT